jgi:hypothetical protein
VVQIFRQTGTDEKAPWAYVNNLVPFTTPATPATANFGWDVDLDEKSNENTVIVGAPGNGGGVFIYKEDEQNTWKPFGVKVFSPDGDDNEFGYSVAIDNSVALIGAKKYRIGPNLSAGKAHVCKIPPGINGNATLPQQLVAPIPSFNAQFGYSVALGDGRMVVGELNPNGVGSVYLYCKDKAGIWKLVSPPIKPENKTHTGNPEFGMSVAVNSDAFLVGAPSRLGNESGSIYAYNVVGCT